MSVATTPYESQRYRVILMEVWEMVHGAASKGIARRRIARAVHASTHTLDAIRKRKRKDLEGGLIRRIDAAFVALAPKMIGDLQHELAMAHADARGVDPGVVAKAVATQHALEELIAEARRAGAPVPSPTGAQS